MKSYQQRSTKMELLNYNISLNFTIMNWTKIKLKLRFENRKIIKKIKRWSWNPTDPTSWTWPQWSLLLTTNFSLDFPTIKGRLISGFAWVFSWRKQEKMAANEGGSVLGREKERESNTWLSFPYYFKIKFKINPSNGSWKEGVPFVKMHASKAAKWQRKIISLSATCRAHLAPRVPSPWTQKYKLLSRAPFWLE